MPASTIEDTIILIGPEGAGKSTVGKLIAATLSKELFTLDRHRDELYAPYGYNKEHANLLYEQQGLWKFYEYWNKFEFLTVRDMLTGIIAGQSTHAGQILDFGAGHSVYEDPAQFDEIRSLVKQFRNVIFLLPCEDKEKALALMEARRGHKLPLNKQFMESECNAKLATLTVFTAESLPEQSAEKILSFIRSG